MNDYLLKWIESNQLYTAWNIVENNYLFFLTMLASEGARYFRSRFVQHNIEEFKKDVDITKGKNLGQNEEIVVEYKYLWVFSSVEHKKYR
jgi:hypothetical protein